MTKRYTHQLNVTDPFTSLTSSVLRTDFNNSLIPRPFPPPVFDCLQYTNMEGEGLGDLITSGDVNRQKVTTQGVVP